SIGKRRRAEGGFPGAETILKQIAEGAARKRVGLRPEGRAPAREGAEIVDGAGATIGHVTSGGFGPTVGGPVAMGYVPTGLATPGAALTAAVRGRSIPVEVAALPFVPQRYYRG
ncbi:MAG: glycine cleavage T C-terminal barrel domain-containing protein, partial [Kiloniellaceae bacterium]